MRRREPSDAELANRELLRADMAAGRLVFRSRPVEAHVQFSTYCNQSCVMCWNGNHPPIVDLDDDLLERLGHELAPTLSVLIPHDGSEPTARRWREICDFARRHDLELDLTTNLQVLSPSKLDGALDLIGQLHLSVDSHVPEVLEQIRPGARTTAVLHNLEGAVRSARTADIDCDVNVVFTTLNAPSLPESVEWFAAMGVEAVCLIRMVDVNGGSSHLDPVAAWPSARTRRTLARISTAAREHRINLWNQIDDELIHAGPSIRDEDRWEERPSAHRRAEVMDHELARLRPGYCRFVHSGLRVTVEGDVSPCGYGAPGELSLGNLRAQEFEAIWNGPTAQDLRRAMLSGDLPAVCDDCVHSRVPPPTESLPMAPELPPVVRSSPRRAAPTVTGPAHGVRAVDPPTFVVKGLRGPVDRAVLHVSPGGAPGVQEVELVRVRRRFSTVELQLPEGLWDVLPSNTGIWWSVSVQRGGELRRLGSQLHCMIRDEPMPRVAGSVLVYNRTHESSTDVAVAVPVSIR